jgi:PhzF family phenazine biosynthesis protein
MRQWLVDAFADAPFKGNPACVVEPLQDWPPDAFMQSLAQENNQAETAFLRRTRDPGRFDLRWFTPTLEVALCGHATLAAGAVLIEELGEGPEGGTLTFMTRSGPLGLVRRGGDYVMDFPADPPRQIPVPAGLEAALGAPCAAVYAARYLIAVLGSEAEVRGLRPNMAALAALGGEAFGGPGHVAAAARADASPVDVVDRFFAPGSGVAEDPATGSAHCSLAPLYAALLNRPRVRFHQAFPGRGADIVTELEGDRVRLIGRARVVAEAQLRLRP